RSPIQGHLQTVLPLRTEPLAAGDGALALFKFLLQRCHYLGLRNCVGQNLKYLVRDPRGRVLACLLFGSAAWQTRPRDTWIGWDAEQRRAHLHLLESFVERHRFPGTCYRAAGWVRVGLTTGRSRNDK